MQSKCQMCGCEDKLEKHHMVPQRVSRSNKYPKKLKTDETNFIWICQVCHNQIHAYYDESTLRDNFNTLDKILADDKIRAFIEWKRKHPKFKTNSTKQSKNRR